MGKRERGVCARVARGEGTAPKHPCMDARSLARFPHLPRERVCVSPRLCSLARGTPHESRVPLLLRLCNNVLTYWST